ncbi:DUF4271 domain-containing protein [Ornithobacterium rhinotracheale]|uniref:DUF4271 domain-containing protein n=1 Tax=Ornithobacterium rhinotracheale (strain ATCC 51463 / DSM 15997 / CCUG 23171 / CIP 104009 / LMG 9086) TaxID=867902 RepID=I3ZZT8_ORNRL|nr:DUF4271 domain-containing protein [Ornithobacterium rhinotracheale]AFL97222.1 hypothetical protein Ornrh_1030 [Ornithobacterium rhinotracheale DSM 15997]AIQ00498.1 hypothetical protein Q785_05755 [Ornithobacterium rhinotracheale ORT-UMN 88]KGB67485.1 hypothetical protein Q787_05640 [Ornithobacterium rhinotracheale H06-030791]MBN3662405.1 DUF4271 domain-containing protein [Ornithobacterium rhinotracheale]MCK0194255.1 DUF4271 domain-containing protein [Ornithobacterium rhinotracheale]
MEGNLRLVENKDGIFLLLMAICILLMFTRWAFRKYYDDLGTLEKFSEKKDNFFILSGIYIVVFSTLVGLFLLPFVVRWCVWQDYHSYTQLLFLVLIIIGFVLFKALVNTLIFTTVGYAEILRNFFISRSYFGIFTTLGLVAFSFLYYFSKIDTRILTYVILGFLGVMFFIKLISFYLRSSKEYKFPIYYIILYLCALEILPFVIVCKFILLES